MQATPPSMPAQAAQLMASKGYSWAYNGAWQFVTSEDRSAWSTAWNNFMPRFGVNYRLADNSVLRLAYARFRMPLSNLRDTLGDFVNQYTGYAQTTNTLGLLNGRPQQVLNDPYPGINPVQEGVGQTLGRYTGLGNPVSFDQYAIRPQINDRFNLSYQRQLWAGMVLDASYFFNWGSRVPYQLNLNMRDPAFTYEQGALLNTPVPNPFRNYLTPETFPGALRNNTTVLLGSLLVPYPQYGAITQTNTSAGRNLKTQSVDLRLQRPFRSGISFLAAYAFQRDRIENFLGDIQEYDVLTSGGESGWEWQPVNPALPEHRVTGALTWQIPVGRNQEYLDDMNPVARGHPRRVAVHDGRASLLGTPHLLQHAVGERQPDARQSDPRHVVRYLQVRGAAGVHAAHEPGVLRRPQRARRHVRRHDDDEVVHHGGPRYRMEFRLEAYNAFNTVIWDQPETTFGNANFGKVTRKRTDSLGREIQIGLRFVF